MIDFQKRVRDRFRAELHEWLDFQMTYYAFTGDWLSDEFCQKKDASDRALLIKRAARDWPARLAELEFRRKKQKHENKKAVKQFVLLNK
jgi:flavodoxin